MVDEAIRKLIPSDPLNKKYALADPLKGLFRLKKGRMRICWIADSEKRTILVLFISDTPRKDGDAKDPYRVLTKLLQKGYWKDDIDVWRQFTEPGPNASVN